MTNTNWLHLPYHLGESPATHAAIGLIALDIDLTTEPELKTLLPMDGVAVYTTRIPYGRVSSVAGLRALESELNNAARLQPTDQLDVVAFGCMSGSILIGEARIAEQIHAAAPGIACTNPVIASQKALNALGCRRIALLTPYLDDVNTIVEEHFSSLGFEMVVKGSFKEPGSVEKCEIPPQVTYDAGLHLGQMAEIDALFISCTSLQVASIVAPLEAALGKPVVTSNQAMAWHCLRLAGYHEAVSGLGQLFRSEG